MNLDSNAAHTPFRFPLPSVAMGGVAVLFLSLAFGVSEIDLAPDWNQARLPFILGLGLCALGSMVLCFFVFPRGRHSLRQRTVSTIIGTLLIGGIVLFSTIEVSSILGGRILLATVHQANSGRWLYVYEYAEIPDGFKRTFLMERVGWVPTMHEIASIPYPVRDVRRNENNAEIELDVLEVDDGMPIRYKGIIHYDFETGSHEVEILR